VKKALPPRTFSSLRPPNKSYKYFENWQAHPFKPDATAFELVNAWWLADASLLAYANEDFVNKTFDETGLKEGGFKVKCFDGGALGAQFFVMHNERFIVVSFRGSDMHNFWEEVLDVITMLKFLPARDESGGRVYGGFKAALEAVWDALQTHLQEIRNAGGGARRLWFTGHSMGAGLTTLAAAKTGREQAHGVQGVYTFGSPRVGDKGFKAHWAQLGLAETTYRFVNHNDIVTRNPPPGLYEHVGVLKYLDEAGQLRSPESPAAVTGFKFRLFKLASNVLSYVRRLLGGRALLLPGFQADHAPICYSINIWNNYDGA
jgi:triacylglycerol lipase